MRCLTVPVIVIALGSGPSFAQDMDPIIQDCSSGRNHPEMAFCVEKRAIDARERLVQVEGELRVKLGNDPTLSESVRSNLSNFDAAVRAFRKYRAEHCAFIGALAAKGNAAVEIRRACEAGLDASRADELQRASWWVRPRQ